MARRLEAFPAAAGARYPWDEWLDGSPWELVRGEDFRSTLSTLRANAQIQSRKRSGRVRTKTVRTDGGREAIVIQFERS